MLLVVYMKQVIDDFLSGGIVYILYISKFDSPYLVDLYAVLVYPLPSFVLISV